MPLSEKEEDRSPRSVGWITLEGGGSGRPAEKGECAKEDTAEEQALCGDHRPRNNAPQWATNKIHEISDHGILFLGVKKSRGVRVEEKDRDQAWDANPEEFGNELQKYPEVRPKKENRGTSPSVGSVILKWKKKVASLLYWRTEEIQQRSSGFLEKTTSQTDPQ